MLGCCVNYWGDFGGNVFADGLGASMRNPKLEYARQMLQGKAEPRPEIPCTTCDQYHAMRRAGGWIGEEVPQFPAAGEILMGVVVMANPGFKFARVAIFEGAAAPRFEISGRLFRFGADTGVYFRAPAPRTLHRGAQCLDTGVGDRDQPDRRYSGPSPLPAGPDRVGAGLTRRHAIPGQAPPFRFGYVKSTWYRFSTTRTCLICIDRPE